MPLSEEGRKRRLERQRAARAEARGERRCPMCTRMFTPKRSDAIYCKDACRQLAHRLKRKGLWPLSGEAEAIRRDLEENHEIFLPPWRG
jgi:hypothetical protein